MIHKHKLYITVTEVISYLAAFRADMESKRQDCLDQIKLHDLDEGVKEMSVKLTNLDYSFFIEQIDRITFMMRKHLSEASNNMHIEQHTFPDKKEVEKE